jgi:hypothetical protein
MQTSRSKFDRALLPDGFTFYRAELGELGRADRKGWALAKSGCPFHQSESKRSFFVHRDGAFNCFNCGAKGGDVIAFLLLRDRVTFKSAAQQLGAWREDMTPGGIESVATGSTRPRKTSRRADRRKGTPEARAGVACYTPSRSGAVVPRRPSRAQLRTHGRYASACPAARAALLRDVRIGSVRSMSDHGIPLTFDDTSVSGDTKVEKLPDVDALLIRSEAGTPKPLLANAIIYLRYHPDWWGVLAFDEFSLYTVAKKSPPWPKSAGTTWTDHDDLLTADWLQHRGILVNPKTAGEAVQTVARDNSFHPVKNYLRSLTWDQRPRLDTWLVSYLGAQDTPFIRAVGARWMLSAVARIFQPGCQVDHTLLLEGAQGIRKSTGLRVLAGDIWFADHLSDLGSKDSRIELHGKWIIEMAELDRVRRGELERVKAFLTARSDHFRVPYGRRAEDVPRSCVFAASTNDGTSLVDESGNRRFWPLRCGEIDVEKLTADKDQLWAEANARYQAGEVWWLDTRELRDAAAVEQEDRYDSGLWDAIIEQWLEDPTQRYETDGAAQLPVRPFESSRERVTIADCLVHAVGKDIDRCTKTDRDAVARCLKHLGWERKQARKGPDRGKRFYAPAMAHGNLSGT